MQLFFFLTLNFLKMVINTYPKKLLEHFVGQVLLINLKIPSSNFTSLYRVMIIWEYLLKYELGFPTKQQLEEEHQYQLLFEKVSRKRSSKIYLHISFNKCNAKGLLSLKMGVYYLSSNLLNKMPKLSNFVKEADGGIKDLEVFAF